MCRTHSVFLSLGLALSFSGLVACSARAGDDASGTNEGATTITPEGDDSPGSLKVVLPPGATNVASAQLDIDSAEDWKPLTTARSPLSVGAHSVIVSTSSPDFRLTSRATAVVVANEETTVAAAAIAPNVSGAPRTLGLEDSASVQIETPATGGWNPAGWIRAGYADGTHALAFVASEAIFHFGVEGMDGARFSLAPGDVKKLDVWDTSQRRRAVLQAPASRALPDGRCGSEPAQWKVSIFSAAHPIALAAGSAIELGFAPWHPAEKYVLSHSETLLWTPLPMGAAGAAPAVFTLGRIDVNDVRLSDGRTVRGTYQIRELDAQGHPTANQEVLRCDLPTGTGVDLPPGKYRIVTHYETVEAGTKQDVADVTVP